MKGGGGSCLSSHTRALFSSCPGSGVSHSIHAHLCTLTYSRTFLHADHSRTSLHADLCTLGPHSSRDFTHGHCPHADLCTCLCTHRFRHATCCTLGHPSRDFTNEHYLPHADLSRSVALTFHAYISADRSRSEALTFVSRIEALTLGLFLGLCCCDTIMRS